MCTISPSLVTCVQTTFFLAANAPQTPTFTVTYTVIYYSILSLGIPSSYLQFAREKWPVTAHMFYHSVVKEVVGPKSPPLAQCHPVVPDRQ